MVLCMIFAHGLGCDGFWSMVLDAMVFGPWLDAMVLVHGIGCFGMYKYVL